MKNHKQWSRRWSVVLGLSITGCALPLPVQTAQPGVDAVLPKADQRISLNFQDVALRTLLQVFADFSGLNLVAAEGVGGQVTIRLTDVPWPQALNIVLQAKGLAYRLDGQVLWVAPQDEWAVREKKQLESRAALEAVSPLQMLPIRLKHARAGDLAQRLQGGVPGSGGGLLSVRGSVLFDPRTNQLFVSDVPSRLVHVETLLQRLDVPIRQVMIEARIVEAERQFGESLGVRLGTGLAMPLQVSGRDNTLAVGAGNAATGPGAVSFTHPTAPTSSPLRSHHVCGGAQSRKVTASDTVV